MDSSKFAVKFFVTDPAAVDARAFLPLFHQWIQTHAIADHLLIDVADYHHVENGPGTVLVAHEANYSTDSSDGKLGLLYTRKQPLSGDFTARLTATFRFALQAAALLEAAPAFAGKLKFRTDNPIFRINDRLAAPNTTATLTTLRPALDTFFMKLYGGPVQLLHRENPETLFEVQIAAPHSGGVAELLQRF
jgi:hypothetical protein